MVGDASVFGGQITLTRNASGSIATASAPPGWVVAKNTAALSKGKAQATVARQIGREGKWITTLRIDPATAQLFSEVQSLRDASGPCAGLTPATV